MSIYYSFSLCSLSKSFIDLIIKDSNCPVPTFLRRSSIDDQSKRNDVSDRSSIQVFYSNVRSLVPKTHFLLNYVSLYNSDIIALSETWLDPTTPSSIFCPPRYNIYRDDRLTGRGGGTLILIKDKFSSSKIDLTCCDVNSNIDAVCCKLHINNLSDLGILCIYRPPNSSPNDNKCVLDIITDFLHFNFKYNIIIGDFNFPEIRWPSHASTAQGVIFLNFCQDNFLSQHVVSATRRASNSLLDLVFSTEGTVVNDISVNEEFGTSDHSIIQFSLRIKPTVSKRFVQRRKFANANWSLFQELLSSLPEWNDLLATSDIDSLWSYFLHSLTSALDKVAPLCNVSRRSFISSSKVRTALRAKRRCYKNLKSCPTSYNFAAFKRSCILLEKILHKDTFDREERVISNSNPKVFWSFVNKRLSRNNDIKSIIHLDKKVVDQVLVADIFNDYFASIFTCNSQSAHINQVFCSSDSKILSNIKVTAEDVHTILKRIPNKTSVDADGLSYMILKNGGTVLCSYLSQLFSLSLLLHRVPNAWKTAVVVPIFKNGDKNDIHNYRPVSVTSCCSRVFERLINNKIIEHLTLNNLTSNSQHGFQRGRSTDTALLEFYNFVSERLDNHFLVEALFFDFSKAFDTVPHAFLINRLFDIGIRGHLLDRIRDFLTDRSQIVRVGESFSRSLPVSSGVVQGSILGPTLFNIFINDIDKCLNHCHILKYADDLRIFLSAPRTATGILDLRHKMQSDINSLKHWAHDSGLSFNIKKCFSVSFGSLASSPCVTAYMIDDSPIPSKDSYKDLGVSVLSPLSFNTHVNDIVAKAFSRLGLVYKLFHTKSPKSLIRLYKSFVRPILEYACLIWNPSTIEQTNKIERVQKRFCRMFHEIRHLSYKEQLSYLGIFSLRARRIRYQLISIFKIYNQITRVDFDTLFTLVRHKRTRGNSLAILPQFSNSNLRLNFFTVTSISLWNKLADADVNAPNLSIFKYRLKSFLNNQDIW